MTEGHEGWDDYAPFYDWENARTLGRRDVPFWRNLAVHAGGPVLELGCGTGRIALPLGRAGVHVVGIDRSDAMLARARARVRRAAMAGRIDLVRGDIRHLPFGRIPEGRDTGLGRADLVRPADKRTGPLRGSRPAVAADLPPSRSATARLAEARGIGGTRSAPRSQLAPRSRKPRRFPLVIAPYGVLQSLLRERDLSETLAAVHEVLEPGGTFGLELVADLPSWEEYRKRISLAGWRDRPGGAHVTLVETVRQDRARHLTIFDQEFTERVGRKRKVRRFSLTFRTLSVPQMAKRLEKAGFEVRATLGDYHGAPWDKRAEVWIILATRP